MLSLALQKCYLYFVRVDGLFKNSHVIFKVLPGGSEALNLGGFGCYSLCCFVFQTKILVKEPPVG